MKYMFRKDYVLGESLNALFKYCVSNIMRELIFFDVQYTFETKLCNE